MQINVNYYSLSPRRFIVGTKNSYGFEKLELIFSEEWASLDKTVTFFPVDGAPITLQYTDEPLDIPHEVMASSGLASFTVCGCLGVKKLVSITGYLDVLDSCDPDGQPPSEPTPGLISQLFSTAKIAVDTADELRAAAESGEFDGPAGPPGPGMPNGGAIGQVIVKSGAGDGVTEWRSPSLVFKNVSAASWVSSTTYSEYGYACTLSLSGVTSDHFAEVVFSHADAISGNYSPVCETVNGGVRIYSKVNTAITLPTVRVVCI